MRHRNPSRTMPSDRAPDRTPTRRKPDDRGINSEQLASIPTPPPAKRAQAQLNLAVMATEQPGDEEVQKAWLAEMMRALNLREHDWRALLKESTTDTQEVCRAPGN